MFRMLNFCLICGCLMFGAVPADAWQDQDPFSDEPVAEKPEADPFADDDPFGTDSGGQDPFADEARKRERVVAEMDEQVLKQQLLRQRMELTAQLDNMEAAYKRELARHQNEKQQFQASIEDLNHELRVLRDRISPAAPVHNDLVRTLVTSTDPAQQLIGLNYLATLSDAVTADEFVPIQLDPTTRTAVLKLLESTDKSIGRLAGQVIAQYFPDAVQIGFQPATGYWSPEPVYSGQTARIRNALNRRARFDYYEVSLRDIVDELSSDYQISIIPDSSIDLDQLVTMQVSDQRSSVALGALLSRLDLTYRVMNDHLAILPADHADLATSLTFNVRGLLGEANDIENLRSLLESRFERQRGELKFETLAPWRLIVIGPEIRQDQVAEFLASLAPGK